MDGMDRKIEKKGISRQTILYGTIIILVLVVLATIIFGDKSSKYNVEVSRLGIDEVVQDVFQDYITDQGIVEPIRTIFLDAVEGGRVEEILIEEGNTVKKGDIILILSNNNLLLEITNNETQVVRAVNELRTARILMDQQKLANKQQIIQLSRQVTQEKRIYNNNVKLFEENHISREEFAQSKETYESTEEMLSLVLENYKNDSMYKIGRAHV